MLLPDYAGADFHQVGNAAEHFTAVSVSVKDKIDLSISVAVRGASSLFWVYRMV